MPIYALATILHLKAMDVEQIRYADDACACGKLGRLCQWWQSPCTVGLSFGYFVITSKTWLVTKEKLLPDAEQLFAGSGMNVTSDGCPYLGAVV